MLLVGAAGRLANNIFKFYQLFFTTSERAWKSRGGNRSAGRNADADEGAAEGHGKKWGAFSGRRLGRKIEGCRASAMESFVFIMKWERERGRKLRFIRVIPAKSQPDGTAANSRGCGCQDGGPGLKE